MVAMAKLVLLLLLLAFVCAAEAARQSSDNQHKSLFDPLYAYDDMDAHTVTAGNSRDNFYTWLKSTSARDHLAPDEHKATFGQRLEANGQQQNASRLALKPLKAVTSSNLTNLEQVLQKRQVALATSKKDAQQVAIGTSPSLEGSSSLATARATPSTEQPRHWSALENYYAKLRDASLLKSLQARPLSQDELSYAVLAQQQNWAPEDRLNSDNYDRQQQVAQYRAQVPSFGSQTKPNFLLPLVGQSERTQLAPLVQYSPAGPRDEQRASGAPTFEQLPSFILGRDGAELWAAAGAADSRVPPGGAASFPTKSSPDHLLAKDRQAPVCVEQQPQRQFEQAPARQPVAPDEFGKARRLNEMMRVQALQQRLKHQQQTFGQWYEQARNRQLLREEAFCGPRNLVHSEPGAWPALGGGPREFPSHMGVYNGSRPTDDKYMCAATWVHDHFAVTLASCVAKWANWTSVAGAKQGAEAQLTVRAAEWNAQEKDDKRPTLVRPIERVHLFPRFHAQLLNGTASPLGEHNLALLEWSEPIDYFELAHVWPACQMQSRQTLRTNACWAPVRNVSLIEHFDADGEGESKLKRSVQMVELPVRLYANDDSECERQTQIAHFNLQHPNYICSPDARRSSWRPKLNSADAFGSGIYCNEGGNWALVSMLHPISPSGQAANSGFGYLDLSYYRPWMRSVISGRANGRK